MNPLDPQHPFTVSSEVRDISIVRQARVYSDASFTSNTGSVSSQRMAARRSAAITAKPESDAVWRPAPADSEGEVKRDTDDDRARVQVSAPKHERNFRAQHVADDATANTRYRTQHHHCDRGTSRDFRDPR